MQKGPNLDKMENSIKQSQPKEETERKALRIRIKEAIMELKESNINYWTMSFKDPQMQDNYRKTSNSSLATRAKVYCTAALLLALLSPILLIKIGN